MAGPNEAASVEVLAGWPVPKEEEVGEISVGCVDVQRMLCIQLWG